MGRIVARFAGVGGRVSLFRGRPAGPRRNALQAVSNEVLTNKIDSRFNLKIHLTDHQVGDVKKDLDALHKSAIILIVATHKAVAEA